MADDNIVRLAELLENGNEVPPTAEDSIALLFADRHSHELRYVAILGRWRHFDGSRWAHDDTLRAFDRARMDLSRGGGRLREGRRPDRVGEDGRRG